MMHITDLEFIQLTKDTPLLPFVSEDEDLNNFLMEDAYANATPFYEKNNFQYFTMLDTLDKTRLMYFDLKPFKDHLEQGI